MIMPIKYISFLADERYRIKDRQSQYLDFAVGGILSRIDFKRQPVFLVSKHLTGWRHVDKQQNFLEQIFGRFI